MDLPFRRLASLSTYPLRAGKAPSYSVPHLRSMLMPLLALICTLLADTIILKCMDLIFSLRLMLVVAVRLMLACVHTADPGLSRSEFFR